MNSKKFCSIVCFKPNEVEQIVTNLDKYYKEWVEKKIDKKKQVYLKSI